MMNKTRREKIIRMNNKEYDEYTHKSIELTKEIDNTSLLMTNIHIEGKCPFCHNNIDSIDKLRERHIKNMQEYNKHTGNHYYVAHIEGSKRWDI